MNLSVIGLGYVGLTTAICFSELGHKVIGVDVDKEKVEKIKNFVNPLENVERIEAIESYLRDYPFEVYFNDHKKAVLNSDISFVCVETPCKQDGSLDLLQLKKACRDIGEGIREKSNHTIVIRSTIFPGSLDILKEEIEKYSGKKEGEGFDLLTNPEFLREKTAIEDFFNPCYIVVGAEKKEIGEKVMDCYSQIDCKKFFVSNDIAQIIKYVNNSWHGCKVAFTNEVGRVCDKLNINKEELMGLFCEDTKLNISSYYMKPGMAYGGHCLSKDLSVLQKEGEKLRLEIPLINFISKSNEIQKEIDKEVSQ